MYYENLPIFRSAMNLAVYIETIVKSFEKYHKYTIGENLRQIERCSKLTIEVCRQSQAWLKSSAGVLHVYM
jgi:hypothetical protein